MEVIHTFWPKVIDRVDDLRQVVKGHVLPKILPEKALAGLVARSEENKGTALLVNILFSVQLFVVLFIFLILSYTLNHIFLSLAAIEDDAPASYTPVVDKDIEERKEVADETHVPRPEPITSSLRSMYRHLCSIEGKRSLLRGLGCAIAYRLAFIAIAGIFSFIPFMRFGILTLLVTPLLVVQLATAWTHIIISAPSKKPFWRRMPPFLLTFRATALPTVAYYIAGALLEKLPSLIEAQFGETDVRGFLLGLVIYWVLALFVMIPSSAVLTRIEASLLPEEEETIIPLDRALTLHKVEGKEYMSMVDAWKSMSCATWIKLYKLYVKTTAVSILFFVIVGLVALIEFIIVTLVTGH
ncbi:hypothetical protein F5Y04DRAFT_149146 [Hypomontagnella monticulosa]|nr:hypothetical protein F5Y04DRAFT_149146 [Hypomontagnella monticulosa]